MKLLIFGSTGSIGRELVKQALEQGHTVTAFARDATKVDIKHNNLQVAQGDVMDPASVALFVLMPFTSDFMNFSPNLSLHQTVGKTAARW